MADSTAVNLTAHYIELNKFGQNGDYGRAAKVARKILQVAPNEQKALHCLVVCLIQESDFKGALTVLDKYSSLSKSLTFEKAYCLYRLNKTVEALNVLSEEVNPDMRHKELKAQVLYRMENYSECLDLYKDLVKNTNDDYEVERETNLAAVVACLALEGSKSTLIISNEDSYELCYNKATRLIGEGNIQEAEVVLRKAESLCRKTLEEDGAAEEEIEEELALIWVQLASTVQLQGRKAEAQQLYHKVLKLKPNDVGLIAVAANNSATINGTQNVFDSRRKLKMAMSAIESGESKLITRQKQSLALNQCLFLAMTAQVDQCKKSIEQLKTEYPGCLMDLLLLQAALEFRSKRPDDALKTLSQLAKSGTTLAVLASGLASVQIHLERNETDVAISVLERLLEQNFRLGLLGSLVTLYNARGQKDRAIQLVNEALEKVNSQKQKEENKNDLKLLLRQAAAFHLKGGKPEKAAKCLEQLLAIDSDDTATLARLVLTYCQFDPVQAQKKSQLLPPLDLGKGVNAVDVDALETATWALGLKHARKAPGTGGLMSPGSTSSKKTPDGKVSKEKKKKRKKILPKNYDPNVPPDPERWLPRRERSTYRPKKKDRRYRDGRTDVGKGTQGSSAALRDAENKFDMSKMKSSPNPVPANKQPPQAPGSGGGQKQKKGGQTQKKKKRGGKF